VTVNLGHVSSVDSHLCLQYLPDSDGMHKTAFPLQITKTRQRQKASQNNSKDEEDL
jgi:hypothetical protein